MINKNEEFLNKSILELDYKLGGLLCNIESFQAINTELGRIRDQVDNTDKSNLTNMGLTFRDLDHKIVMIDELLRHTLKDLINNYEDCQHTKTGLFLEYVKDDENE